MTNKELYNMLRDRANHLKLIVAGMQTDAFQAKHSDYYMTCMFLLQHAEDIDMCANKVYNVSVESGIAI